MNNNSYEDNFYRVFAKLRIFREIKVFYITNLLRIVTDIQTFLTENTIQAELVASMECRKRTADANWSRDNGISTKLVAVRKSDVPEYLHHSEFYQSLEDNDEEILIPNNCLKLDDQIHNIEGLRWLLLTLRFWIADPMLESILEYTFTTTFKTFESIFA